MIANSFRALAAALLIAAFGIGVTAIETAAPAYAATVRAAVGRPLQEAQSLAAAGKYAAAMEKVREAEAVPNKTAAESQVVEQMRQYIAVKSGDVSVGGAAAAKAKFAADYNAGRYEATIADGEMLRKAGALDGASMQIIAQAYYLSGNKAGCVRYIKQNFGSGGGDAVLELERRCAYDAGDSETERAVLEQLVARSGKPEYWQELLSVASRSSGLSDHQTLDIYRLKLMTGSMKDANDYMLLAELALQLGFAGEAQNVMQKGIDSKVLSGDRPTRLLNMAKGQAATNAANAAKNQAAASAAKNGDALVKIGEDDWGQGKYADAIKSIQAGIDKGATDPDNAQIRLGQAYLGAGQKDAAIRAFNKATKNPTQQMIAHLWSLLARR